MRHRSTWAGAIAGAIIAIMFTAGVQARAEEREEFHQTYALTAGGRVSLENINGNATITGWDRNEVKVDAVKIASDKQRLQEAKIVVDAHPDSVSIKTEYPHNDSSWHNDEPARVEYTLSVPRTAQLEGIKLVNGSLNLSAITGKVHAETVNGRLTASRIGGRVDLSAVNGPMDIGLERLDSAGARLNCVNGALAVTLPSDAQAEITANTVHGRISNEFGLSVDRSGFVGNSLRATLGAGGPQLSLNNVNGSVTIRHASDGKPLSKGRSKTRESDDSRL